MHSTEIAGRAATRRLGSWKEIAAYFGKEVRTVRRWEAERGLPVHRLPGNGRGSVYAFENELDDWLSDRRPSPLGGADSLHNLAAELPPAGNKPHPVREEMAIAPLHARALPPAHRAPAAGIGWMAAAALVAAVMTTGFLGRHLFARPTNHTAGTAAVSALSTSNAEARALCLKGKYYWEHRTEGGLNRAVDAYTQAIIADSNDPDAYAGLAESYDLMPEYSSMPQQEAFTRAMAAAEKAVTLDADNAVAHRALAFALFWSQTDIPRAFREFDRAIALAPNDAESHHWYATALNAVQRTPDARREIDLAQQQAPVSRAILADQAWIHYFAGDPQAVAKLEELEADEPDFSSPPDFLAQIDLAQGDYSGYVAQLARLAGVKKNAADILLAETAKRGWNAGGKTGLFLAIRQVQQRTFTDGKSDGYDLAHTCALLGDRQNAVRYLQTAYAARDLYIVDALRSDWAPQLNGYPPFESLRAKVRQRFGIAFS